MSDSIRQFGSVARYALLPGLLPRVREFFGSGFAHLSFFMANVYRAVRLLPEGHPYLNYDNMGRYGLWNVMAEARSNLVFSRRHIDQILVFFCLLLGIVLLVLQCGVLAVSLFVQSAWAGGVGAWWARFFVTANPEDDLAFVTLDRIFGIPDIYNSRISTGADGPFPSPFHLGLQELFSYYSIGIFAIAIIVIIYYVMTLVAETAQSGQPFGRRFNGWAGARLILMIALLAPISTGMNIAQLGTLRVAKWGSSLATNGWILFNDTIVDGQTQLGQPDSLIAIPNRPALNTYLEWATLSLVCYYMHEYIYDRTIDYYVVRTVPESAAHANNGPDFQTLSSTDYAAARTIAAEGTIMIVAGEQDPAYAREHRSQIKPVCGAVAIQVVDVENEGSINLQEAYYNIVRQSLVTTATAGLFTAWQHWGIAQSIALRFTPTANRNPSASGYTIAGFSTGIGALEVNTLRNLRLAMLQEIQTAIDAARTAAQADAEWDTYGQQYGWGGAGMWYNRLAEYNGGLFASVYNLPTPVRYPEVMEWVRERRGEDDEQVQPRDRYRPYSGNGDADDPSQLIEFRDQGELYMAQAMYYVQRNWEPAYIPSDQNAVLDYINLIFGTSGLFNMRRNIDEGVHPMAALVGIGSSLIQSTVINLGAAALGGAMGGAGYMTNTTVLKSLGMAIGSITFKIALLGLSIGFLLFYVVPFLPFIYFTFAFGGWIKAVFEAMVGLPLWALAHLRIDGEGINGPMALDGFFLVLEIFVRPIVIIIALISSVSIFSAMVTVLNSVWDLVITNLTGHMPSGAAPVSPPGQPQVTTGLIEALRNTVDKLFYTVLYAVVVYIIGLSSFKMIDLVPNYVLRWMGKGIRTIGEGELSEDPGQSLLRNVSLGSSAMIDRFSGTSHTMMGMLMGRK